MKRSGILNPALCQVLASMGHTDSIVVCDAGLPIPEGPERIDLSVCPGLPAFRDVLAAIAAELQIEKALTACEFEPQNPQLYHETVSLLKAQEAAQGAPIALARISHEEFKRMTRTARAIVRTGECTPFANVILYSGVPF
ncbi:D-ribose pyranase [Defluviimonas sp. 20V17]|nr:D-ribose pyranase [Allgaiera indica]KDB02141.1 D-ribose pyranase [Defluviimonas sp. 20V17]GHE02984.1 D-ribose pyranase [Allgaiera indica]